MGLTCDAGGCPDVPNTYIDYEAAESQSPVALVVWSAILVVLAMPATWQLSPRIAYAVGACWIIGVILSVVIYKLQRHEPALIKLDDEAAQITLTRCMMSKRVLIQPTSATIPYHTVQRVDLEGREQSGRLRLHTTKGQAVVSRSITKVDELVCRLDAIALENEHSELYVTMEQLRWRRLVVWLVISAVGLGAAITLLAWFTT